MSEKDRAKSEIIVAKQRNGPTGTVHLNFISRFTRFNNPDAAQDVNGDTNSDPGRAGFSG